MNGLKKLIGVAALAVAAIIWGTAAEAGTLLSFKLESADYNYSWTMDSDPTPVSSNMWQTNIASFSSPDLPAGNLWFYDSAFLGGLGFITPSSSSVFDFSGDQIYSGDEATPHFAPGVFFMTFDNNTGLAYAAKLTVAAVATTPIPAALPLFAAALGGVGYLGWRRRKQSAAA